MQKDQSGQGFIRIRGARQHNLKNIDLDLPRNRLIVFTGLSGSGKSSLAFDTLFAEGQRKYVESLSAYARQFLDQLQKPEVDYIEGLSPAIAIEQRSSAANPRSTIATTTEIYDYLRLLYSAVGQPHDPVSGAPVQRQTPQQIADIILSWPEGTRLILLAPLVTKEKGEFRDVIEKVRREGFVRVRIDGEILELDAKTNPRLNKEQAHTIEAVVDRLVVREGLGQRLADSLETSLRWGENRITVLRQEPGAQDFTEVPFSTDFCNPATGFTLPRLTPKHFSFNSHLGACTECHGLGTKQFCDPGLMLDLTKSLKDGAVKPWKTGQQRMKAYYGAVRDSLARAYKVDPDKPLSELPESFREVLLFGSGNHAVEIRWSATKSTTRAFEGVVAQVERLLETSESEFTRQRLKAFTSWHECPACKGQRLKPEILAVRISAATNEREASAAEIQQLGIQDFCSLTIADAANVASRILLPPNQEKVVGEVLREIRQRLHFLNQVGLGYLGLNRESGTLSGGESQRIRLATQIGSGLAGVLYVLDEPSIGLHQRDNDRLIDTLRGLRDLGNTVVVVEHDEDTIRACDYVVDLGPGAGPRGGELVAEGTVPELLSHPVSLTGQYLSGKLRIPVPKLRVPPRQPRSLLPSEGDGWLTILGAAENNLKSVDAAFPVGCFTCLTGVSGSGKSTLLNGILRSALARDLHGAKERPGLHAAMVGGGQFDKVVVIDQSPIGRSPRSNPATYSGALGPIRTLFSEVPASRVRGYGPSRFSFNVKGGRCEHCQGDGHIRIEMHFLADVYVECEVCRGRRYNRETLEVTYKGKNIADVLEMTVDEASRFFRAIPALSDKLDTMRQVGLGYLRLGQSATTLSGGEAQRLKLAAELARKSTGRTIYLLDEPTTGLHFADIHKLLEVLLRLRDAGNTLIVIEHNLEVIKCADWIVDLGPEGGAGGGRIVAEGPPERVADVAQSATAGYLKGVLKK